MQKLQLVCFLFLFIFIIKVQICNLVIQWHVLIEVGRERNRATKITRATFNWKETSLNKPKNGGKNLPYDSHL